MELRESPDPATPFLDTVEGEISFFRSIMRARPIGLHRHFHVLSMRTAIHQDTGRYVSIDDIWEKLRSCYNVDALESLVRDSTFCDDAYLYSTHHRTQRGSSRQGPRIPRQASLTRLPHQTTSPCTPISARSSPFHTTKHWTPSSPAVASETRHPRPLHPLRRRRPPKDGAGGGEGEAWARGPRATCTRKATAARSRSKAATRASSRRRRKGA